MRSRRATSSRCRPSRSSSPCSTCPGTRRARSRTSDAATARRSPSPATRCSPAAAGASSKARRRRCWSRFRSSRAARRHARLLRARIHARQPALCAGGRAWQPGAARARAREQDKRDRGLPTVPARMDDERATNPFLRAAEPAVLAAAAGACGPAARRRRRRVRDAARMEERILNGAAAGSVRPAKYPPPVRWLTPAATRLPSPQRSGPRSIELRPTPSSLLPFALAALLAACATPGPPPAAPAPDAVVAPAPLPPPPAARSRRQRRAAAARRASRSRLPSPRRSSRCRRPPTISGSASATDSRCPTSTIRWSRNGSSGTRRVPTTSRG